ncbi:MAG: hypothetical protein IT208_00525 [Chthonomonadales bacterium]|nr:hypothetical protein [Chthonomonadales bacterium]
MRSERLPRAAAITSALALAATVAAAPATETRSQTAGSRIWRLALTRGADTPMEATMALQVWGTRHTTSTLARVRYGSRGRYRMDYEAPRAARGRIVCFDGRTRWQYEPRARTATRADSPPPDPAVAAAHALILRNYRIALVAERATAAGRPCYLLEVRPRRPGKVSQRRWVDRATYRTLRVETRAASGALVSLLSYQQVRFPRSTPDDWFTLPPGDRSHVVAAPAPARPKRADEPGAVAARLGLRAEGPLGFRATRALGSRIGGKPATQVVYSDGLASLSVFVREAHGPRTDPPRGWRRLRLGHLTAFLARRDRAQAIAWFRGRRGYTAVSAIGAAALEAFVAGQAG